MIKFIHPVFNLALSLVLLTGCGGESPPPEKPLPEAGNYNSYQNMGPEAEFLGKEACKSCHIDKYKSFTESEMGRSFKEASLSKSAANFENPQPVYDPNRDFYYLPFHRGEELFLREYRLKGKDTTYLREEKIDYIVGSGQHTNSHIMEIGGYFYQMPLTWYAQKGQWDLPPGFEGGNNTRFTRQIETECMACHNARPEYVANSDNKFLSVQHGIDCERCHGPGSIHVRDKRNGLGVDTNQEIDYSIVNPAKLPLERQFDLCQRCHLQGVAVLEEGKEFEDWRPGMKLSNIMNVFLPRYKDNEKNFIMASHPDRLKQSACFIGSGDMTCITCHDPHVSIQKMEENHYNRVCQSCHLAKDETLCELDLQAQALEPGGCVACHMPPSSTQDIPHVTITDHKITRKPKLPQEEAQLTAEEAKAQKRVLRILCGTQTDPNDLVMAKGYLAYFEQFNDKKRFLDSAGVYLSQAQAKMPAQSLIPALVRYRFLAGDYAGLVQLAEKEQLIQSEDPWVLYRCAEAFKGLKNKEAELKYLKKAVDLAPNHLKFKDKYGMALLTAGDLKEAIIQFNQVIFANPEFYSAYNNRGYAHALNGDMDLAEPDFRKALSLEPDAELALANMASLFLNTGRKEMGLPFAERLVEIAPGNDRYRQFLKMMQ